MNKSILLNSLLALLLICTLIGASQQTCATALVTTITDKWECMGKGGLYSGSCAIPSSGDCTEANGFASFNDCVEDGSNKKHCVGPANAAACPNSFYLDKSFLTDAVDSARNDHLCITESVCKSIGLEADSALDTCKEVSNNLYCFQQGKQAKASGSGKKMQCVATGDIKPSEEDCLTNGLEFDDAADLCKVGTTVTDIYCFKAGYYYKSNKCYKTTTAETGISKPSEEICLTNGVEYDDANTKCTKGSTVDKNYCFKAGYYYKSSKCYKTSSAETGLDKPSEDDCFILGYAFSNNACALYNADSITDIEVSKCPIKSTEFTVLSKGTCLPKNGVANLCLERGLIVNGAACEVPGVCPTGFTKTDDRCIPDDEFACLSQGMIKGTKFCEHISEDKDCSSLNSNLKVNDDLNACKFLDNVRDEIQSSICLSFGHTLKDGECVRSQNCPVDFTKTNSLCFPDKDKNGCKNNVMIYQSESKFCQSPNTEALCKQGEFKVNKKSPAVEWCVEQTAEFDYCSIPDEKTCFEDYKKYYDKTESENYRCKASCDDADYRQENNEKKCVASCEAGYYANTDTNNKLCSVCPEGCATCTAKDNCSTCDDYYVKITDSASSKSTCEKCTSNCKKCTTAKIKCTTCNPINFVLDADSDENKADNCRQCIKFCKSCSKDSYETVCDTCYDDYTGIEEDNKITKCQCKLKTENLKIRKEISDSQKIENLNSYSAWQTFYCEIFNYFKKAPGDTCHDDETLLDAAADKNIMTAIFTQLSTLLTAGKDDFSKSKSNAYELITRLLATEMAMNSGVMDTANVKLALSVIGNANFQASSLSNYVILMNQILSFVTDSTFVLVQTELDACFEYMNTKLLESKSGAASKETDNIDVLQVYSTSKLTSETLGLKFTEDNSLDVAEDTALAAGRFMLEKRSYGEASAESSSLWQSNRQYFFKFAETYKNSNDEELIRSKTVEFKNNCLNIVLPLDEEIKLVNSANGYYIAQYSTTSKKWDVTAVTQTTQTNDKSLEGCVKAFDNPFIIIENQKSSTSIANILSITMMLLISLFFIF